jgi:hypothetical protein
MGIDLRNGYRDLKEHINHEIEVAAYGGITDPANIALQCNTCGCVLLDFDKPLVMTPEEAWGYAAQWGSYMNSWDPGACMYGFNENCRPQSEQHRQDVLEQMTQNRASVVKDPDNYEEDDLEKIDAFVRFITDREVSKE